MAPRFAIASEDDILALNEATVARKLRNSACRCLLPGKIILLLNLQLLNFESRF